MAGANTNTPNDGKTRLALLLTLLAAILIAIGSFSPNAGPAGPPGQDKLLHAIAFGGLVLPAAIWARRHLIWLVPVALVYGGAIEVIQPFVGRGAEWLDLLADAIGIALALLFVQILPSRWRN